MIYYISIKKGERNETHKIKTLMEQNWFAMIYKFKHSNE